MTRLMTERLCRMCGYRILGREGQFCPRDGMALLDPEVLSRHPRHTLLGRVLGGKYALVDLIGMGGFGAVYRAIHVPVGREVAVKVMRPLGAQIDLDPEARFFREARAVGQLQCESTVHLYDYGFDEVRFMVLEYVRGTVLAQVLRDEGRLPPRRAVNIALQILESLGEAHSHGIIHRDLKPDNVMVLCPAGAPANTSLGHERVKVLDFGIAKLVDGEEDAASFASMEGLVVGTPHYMAPEQGRGHAVPASDLYALGVMLYEMLTGRRPFEGGAPLSVLQAHQSQAVPPFAVEFARLAPLEAVIAASLRKNPLERPLSADELSRALVAALQAWEQSAKSASAEVAWLPGSVSADALAQTAPPRVLPRRRRQRRWWSAAVLTMGALTVTLGASPAASPSSPSPPPPPEVSRVSVAVDARPAPPPLRLASAPAPAPAPEVTPRSAGPPVATNSAAARQAAHRRPGPPPRADPLDVFQ